jgi:hypothetical protein
MKKRSFSLWLVLIFCLALAGCAPQGMGMDPVLHASPNMEMDASADEVIDVPVMKKPPSETQPLEASQPVPVISQEPASAEPVPEALESAQSFMDWYIAYLKDNQKPDGEIIYPFEESAHKQAGFLTETYIAQVDEILAVPILERGIFDPLMHKWGFMQDYTLEPVSMNEQAAALAVKYIGYDLPSWAGATLDLVNTETGWKIDDIRADNVASPAGVAILFYDWYCGYYRAGGNPLEEGAYKTSEYLSESFIQRVEQAQGGPDPFVLSWQIPNGGGVLDEPVIRGDKARVNLLRYFFSSQPQPLVVHLEKSNGTWLIVDVSLEDAPLNPTDVVQAFYEWYLEYTKADSDGNFRNALVDRAYQNSPYLADTFKAKLDQREQGYDPLLCAQDIPTSITTDGFFIEKISPIGEARQASVVIRTSFPGHIFMVDLGRPGGSKDDWKITGVTCSMNPEGVVKTFYTWYQGCLEGSATCRTPTASQAFPSTGLVTERFANQVEALREEFARSGGAGYDPVMMAQADYYAFDVLKVYEITGSSPGSSRARVFLRNLSQGQQNSGDQGLLVTLVVDGPFWKIDNVTAYFENSPEAVAGKFYTWYTNLLRSERNPEVEYGFEPEAYLSAEYIQEVRSALESKRMEGYNSILLVDRLPVKIEVADVKVEGNRASLVVERYFEGQDSPLPMAVEMEKIDDWWVITGAEE